MRRFSLVLIFLIAFGAVSSFAGEVRREREERNTFVRLIRIVKSIFKVKPNGDIMTPPLPAPPSAPRP